MTFLIFRFAATMGECCFKSVGHLGPCKCQHAKYFATRVFVVTNKLIFIPLNLLQYLFFIQGRSDQIMFLSQVKRQNLIVKIKDLFEKEFTNDLVAF